jgi:hypothetical protein
MKFMLLIHGDQQIWDGLSSWSKEDFKVMVEFMRKLDKDLTDSGELLELNGLSGAPVNQQVEVHPIGEPPEV